MPTRQSSTTEPAAGLRAGRSVRVRAVCAVAPLFLAGASPGPARPNPSARDPLVYASNERGNSVTVISARTNAVLATIPVGKRPRGLALSPDHATVYVALGEDNAIAAIDGAQPKLTATFPADSDPELLVLSPDGRTVYVSNEQIANASGDRGGDLV